MRPSASPPTRPCSNASSSSCQTFRGLFRAIDEGNAGLNIPAYNGGLFALDPALDALQVPDEVCAHFKEQESAAVLRRPSHTRQKAE